MIKKSKRHKKPIILLHGALGDKGQLNVLKDALEKTRFDVYTLNFSGHGGEPFSKKEFGIETFAAELLAFIRKNKIEKADIFGYSMGGYVAVLFASLYPKFVKKVITLGTKFDWSPESAEKEVKKLNPEKILEKIPAFARILEHRHAPNNWKELLLKTSAMMADLGKMPLLTKETLANISHPVLVCLGDSDDMADRQYSETVSEFLPKGKFQLLLNTPHALEKVDILMLHHIILDFIT